MSIAMVSSRVSILLMFAISLLTAQVSVAAAFSPVGLWQSIDDKTNKPRSLIRISQHDGKLSAVIEKGLLETDTADAVCDQCTDERKGQKIIGMTIVKDLKKEGNQYDGGTILDPENGKTYQCKMKLNVTGDELEVRGYIGISLIGRSQIWKRIE